MRDFQLIDLVSQREAVRKHLRGSSAAEIVAGLGARGQLSKQTISSTETFFFESAAGLQAVFFFDGDEMIFIGDHTTVLERPDYSHIAGNKRQLPGHILITQQSVYNSKGRL